MPPAAADDVCSTDPMISNGGVGEGFSTVESCDEVDSGSGWIFGVSLNDGLRFWIFSVNDWMVFDVDAVSFFIIAMGVGEGDLDCIF